MTYAELVDQVAEDTGFTKKAVREVLTYAFDAIAVSVMQHGERTAIPDFGAFTKRTRKARQVLNPQTNQPMRLPRSETLGFRCSSTNRKTK